MPERAAFEKEQNKSERVAEQLSPVAWSGDAAQWWNRPQPAQADQLVSLPTLHLDDSRLNMYENYSVNSDVAQLYMKNRPAIVRINTMDPKSDASFSTSAGSGSLIDPSGIIATGYHVVKNATALRVKTADGTIYDAKILDVDPAKDEALIQIKSSNPWAVFPTVKLAADSSRAGANENLVALGFPKNQDAMHVSILNTESRLPLSALQIKGGLLLGEDKDRVVIKAHGPVQNGNSGGPAFDRVSGEQIGIVNLSDEANGNAYITPIEDLQRFMASTKAKYNISSLPVQLPTERSSLPIQMPSSPFGTFTNISATGSGMQRLDRLLSK